MAEKRPTYKTQYLKGTAKYPRLNEPDTKFNKAGVFSTKLIPSVEAAEPIIAMIDEAIEAAYAAKVEQMKADKKSPALIAKVKRSDPPYVEVYDEEGNLTGEHEFSMKMNHTFTKKDGTVEHRFPTMVDSKGNTIKGKKPSVWGGSILTVAFQAVPFDSPVAGVGVSLRMQGVQINKLVSGGGSNLAFGSDGDYEPEDDDAEEPSFPSNGGEAGGAEDNPDF